jgi:hypothetical protein
MIWSYFYSTPYIGGISDLEQACWKRADLGSQARLSEIMHDSESMLTSHPGALLEQDLSWITVNSHNMNHDPLIYLCKDGHEVLGYAPIVLQPSSIPFTLGEITFGNYAVQQLTMYGDPLIRVGTEEGQERQLITDLFYQLRSQISSRQVVLLLCVPCQGSLYKTLKETTNLNKQFYVLQYAANYKRRLIALPKTFDVYLKQLGPRTRSDLNRNSRKLKEHVNNELEVKCYTDRLSVAEFLKSAEAISKKTYQWNLLKRGLRDREHFEIRLSLAAEQGWLRCYILFCRGQPIAFMVGYLHQGRYYSTDIGYDPEWTTWSVGNVLHCEVVRDLIEKANGAKLFDFMGDRPTHERLSNNVFIEEANFYLFPKSLEGTALYLSLRLTDKFSTFVSHTLETFHLKTRIRKLIRQISTTRHSD